MIQAAPSWTPALLMQLAEVGMLHRTYTSWSRQQQEMFAYMCQSAAEEVAGVGKKGMRARIPLLMPGLSESCVMGAYDWYCTIQLLTSMTVAS